MVVAIKTKRWTLAEVHRLPDDGNKYELVRGELFVTPPPTDTPRR
jgi:Uma2 family endonuclease